MREGRPPRLLSRSDVVLDVRDDVERAVDEIVASGMDHVEELGIALLAALREDLPGYGRGWPRAIADDLAASVKRTASVLLDCVRRDRPPARQDLVSLTMVALQRARDGIARHDLHSAMEVCRRVGFSFLMRESGAPEGVAASAALQAASIIADRLDAYLHVMRQAVDEGYDEAENQPDRNGRSRSEATIANRLLDGRWLDESEIRNGATLLGKPLGRWHGVAVVAGPTKGVESLAISAGRFCDGLVVTSLQEGTRWDPIPHVPIVISVGTPEKWAELTQPSGALSETAAGRDLVAVVSGPVASLHALPERYRRLHQDLGYLKAARDDPGSISARRLELFALWGAAGSDIGRLTRFVRQVFESLEQEANADLLFGILEAFCRQCGPNRWGDVASEVNMHRNTLMPQVRKIERLTGLSFESVADVHELVTAVGLRRFLRSEFDKLDSFE